MLLYASYVVVAILLFLSLYVSIRTPLLRNPSPNPDAKFSFDRVQALWWTIIVVSSFVVHYGRTRNFESINSDTLILLSISLTTAAAGSLIDVSKTGPAASNSRGLMTDILSDRFGVSMHRFQGLIFNFIFGLTFLVEFWTDDVFPEFNDAELALMGVSSGAYLAIKTNENRTEHDQSPPSPSVTNAGNG